MRTVSRFDCFPFPGYYNDIQQMPYFIVREFIPLFAFKERAKWKRWKNADKVKGWTFAGRPTSGDEGSEFEAENLYSRLENTGWCVGGTADGTGTTQFVELWHYYEAPPGGVGCRAYAVIADGEHLLCCRAREYDHAMKPIADLLWQPIDTQLWQAHGVARLIRPFQDQINAREAMYSDLMEFYRNPSRIAGPNLGIKPLTRLLPRPGQIIAATGDPSALRLLEMPPPPQGLLQQSDRAHNGIQRAALTDLRGVVGPGAAQDATNTTATGKRIFSDSQAKIAAFVQLFFESRGIESQLQQFAGLCQQYANPEGEMLTLQEKNDTLQRSGRVNGGRVTLGPPDIAGNYTFRAVGSLRATENPEYAQQLQAFAQMIFSDPELAKDYSKRSFASEAYEVIFHRPLSRHEKSDQEKEQDAKQQPPLPPPTSVKYEKAPREIQMQIEAREGFEPAQTPMTADQQLEVMRQQARQRELTAQQIGKTVGSLAEKHLAPAPAPKPMVPA
jgi:hypothetical protein